MTSSCARERAARRRSTSGSMTVNMGLARRAILPVVVVGDIDRGGVFAGFHGTVALLDAADQALVAGFVVNKFRGDAGLLSPGLRMIARTTGRPVLGVLPWLPDLWLDAEDSLDLVGRAEAGSEAPAGGVLRRRHQAPADLELHRHRPAGGEPGVAVQFTASPADVLGADLAVLPGSRATVADLAWLRSSGLADALVARAAAGRPILGICGGFQMLTREIADDVESGVGTVLGLGLLPASVRFTAEKVLERPVATAYGVHVTTAYAIHHGRVTVDDGAEDFLDGCRAGAVWGTSWHGVLEEDGLRRAFLREVASLAGLDDFEVDGRYPVRGTTRGADRAAGRRGRPACRHECAARAHRPRRARRAALRRARRSDLRAPDRRRRNSQ